VTSCRSRLSSIRSQNRTNDLTPPGALGRNVLEDLPPQFAQAVSGQGRCRLARSYLDTVPKFALLDFLIDDRNQVARLIRPSQLVERNDDDNLAAARPIERQSANLEEICKRLDPAVVSGK
jgi:hypothetical protein